MFRYTTIAFLFLIITACNDKGKQPGQSAVDTSSAPAGGREIFRQNCALCHGEDGKLGANGSKDLTVSTLSLEERVALISEGKGVMTAFENILNEGQIKEVAAYTMTLK